MHESSALVKMNIAAVLGLFLGLVSAFNASSGPVCPTDANAMYTDESGYQYHITCGSFGITDPPPNLLYRPTTNITTSLKTCCDICDEWNNGGLEQTCNAAILDDQGCGIWDGSFSVRFDGGNDSFAGITGEGSTTTPPADINFYGICNASRESNSLYSFYVDPDMYRYAIFCGKTSAAQNLQSTTIFAPNSLAGCIQACSDNNIGRDHPPDYTCYGVVYDPDQKTCNFDVNQLGTLIDSSDDSAYVIGNQTCYLNSTATYYVGLANDNYTITALSEPGFSEGALSTSTQSSACSCVDQCSLFNLAYPNSSLPCNGAQFDQGPAVSPNCMLTSS